MSLKRISLKQDLDCTQWSPGLKWIENEDLCAVVFFDENLNLAKKYTGKLKPGIVLLKLWIENEDLYAVKILVKKHNSI